jgi:TP901 family phage tail tape measure protein
MALKSAGDFESSMNVLQSVSGATADDMADLEEQALALGASTSFSAGEAAEAMLELGKAGLGANDIIGSMPGVLSLAAAGGMDVATAAGIAANAVNTFGLEAAETTMVANMLAAAANASSADVSDLAAGFQMAGSVFASNGQSMADLTTAMALMANAGIAGSDAGTSLKTMMMRLAAPTAEAADAMAALGLNVYELDGSMRPFQDVIADLGAATSTLSDEQRNAALSTIFGADAIRAATILTSEGADGWVAMEAAVTKAGAAEEAAAARMKGLSGALDYLQGSIDSALIALSAQFLPALSEMLRVVADSVTGFTTLSPEIQTAALAFAAVAAAAGPVLLAITGIGAALGFILSPIGLIIIAVGALAAAWSTNFGGIRDITAEVAGAIGPALQSVLEPLTWVAEAMADAGVNSIEASEAITALPAVLQPVATAFQNAYVAITAMSVQLQAFLAPALARVQEAFTAMSPALSELSGPLSSLQTAFMNLWTVAQPILAGLAQAIGVTLAVAADLGINTLATAIETLPAIVTAAVNNVTATINLISTTISGLAELVTAMVNGDWAAAWTAAEGILEGFATFFSETFFNFNAIADAVMKGLKSIVVDTLTDMGVNIDSVLTEIAAQWQAIWDGMSKAIQPVLDAIDALKKGIQSFQSWIGGISMPNPFAGIGASARSTANSIDTNFVNFVTGRASGGPVQAGTPYMVGEEGPELFVPSRSGSIIPNDFGGAWGMGSGGTGNGVTIENISVYNEVDLHTLAYQVAQLLGRRAR